MFIRWKLHSQGCVLKPPMHGNLVFSTAEDPKTHSLGSSMAVVCTSVEAVFVLTLDLLLAWS